MGCRGLLARRELLAYLEQMPADEVCKVFMVVAEATIQLQEDLVALAGMEPLVASEETAEW
ncbi:hypothetical protein LMG29542_02442 [Paraburkholderia humisilvae]|uniref:Uncharacterized protein n=1 Tax=Paraburkholderia humisilvae TaxID=627669 RepID=A0A6J5DP32_9BURK|nr:hypothetical protein LMG29542_02442 [Paraburkholderia humisilvae]